MIYIKGRNPQTSCLMMSSVFLFSLLFFSKVILFYWKYRIYVRKYTDCNWKTQDCAWKHEIAGDFGPFQLNLLHKHGQCSSILTFGRPNLSNFVIYYKWGLLVFIIIIGWGYFHRTICVNWSHFKNLFIKCLHYLLKLEMKKKLNN